MCDLEKKIYRNDLEKRCSNDIEKIYRFNDLEKRIFVWPWKEWVNTMYLEYDLEKRYRNDLGNRCCNDIEKKCRNDIEKKRCRHELEKRYYSDLGKRDDGEIEKKRYRNYLSHEVLEAVEMTEKLEDIENDWKKLANLEMTKKKRKYQ